MFAHSLGRAFGATMMILLAEQHRGERERARRSAVTSSSWRVCRWHALRQVALVAEKPVVKLRDDLFASCPPAVPRPPARGSASSHSALSTCRIAPSTPLPCALSSLRLLSSA